MLPCYGCGNLKRVSLQLLLYGFPQYGIRLFVLLLHVQPHIRLHPLVNELRLRNLSCELPLHVRIDTGKLVQIPQWDFDIVIVVSGTAVRIELYLCVLEFLLPVVRIHVYIQHCSPDLLSSILDLCLCAGLCIFGYRIGSGVFRLEHNLTFKPRTVVDELVREHDIYEIALVLHCLLLRYRAVVSVLVLNRVVVMTYCGILILGCRCRHQMVACLQRIKYRIFAQIGLYHYALRLRSVALWCMIAVHITARVAVGSPHGYDKETVLYIGRLRRILAEAEIVAAASYVLISPLVLRILIRYPHIRYQTDGTQLGEVERTKPVPFGTAGGVRRVLCITAAVVLWIPVCCEICRAVLVRRSLQPVICK